MEETQLEFLISQYADGTLDAEQAAALEAVLRADPVARAMLAEHRRVNVLLASHTPVPVVKFERLGKAISDRIDRPDADQTIVAPQFAYARWFGAAAMIAASVVIGLMIFRSGPTSEPQGDGLVVGGGPRVIEVAVPSVETAQAPAVALVTLDAPTNVALFTSLSWQELSPAGARIVVSAGEPPLAPDALSGH